MAADTALEVVLASGSAQRREMLERLGISFSVRVSGVEEIVHGDPSEVVLANALLKARAVSEPGMLTIGCDTDVVVEGHLIGKPEDALRAHEYLAQLSGRTHEVVSGLALLGPGDDEVRTGTVGTRVTFRTLERSGIDAYVATGEWQGRAGGYAIQGVGASLIERVEGDISNVIGMPLGLLVSLAPELMPTAP